MRIYTVNIMIDEEKNEFSTIYFCSYSEAVLNLISNKFIEISPIDVTQNTKACYERETSGFFGGNKTQAAYISWITTQDKKEIEDAAHLMPVGA